MRFPKVTSKVILVLFGISTVWLALVVGAPLMVPSDTLTDLSGRVGVHDNDAQFSSIGALPRAMYWIGDAECHQLAERSYFLNGNQMPFCSRDLGLFTGLVFALGFVAFYRYKINPVYAILGLVPIGLDGGLQAVTSYESTNPLRLFTGIVAGAAMALLIAHFLFVIQEDNERSRRKAQARENRPNSAPSPPSEQDGMPGKSR